MVLSNRCEEAGDLKGLWGSVKRSLVSHALYELRHHFSLEREGMENTRPSSWAPPPLLGVRGQERGSLSPESRAGRKAFGYYPEEESFAVSGQMGGVRWNQLAEKKGENSEFQFSKQRLFFFFF